MKTSTRRSSSLQPSFSASLCRRNTGSSFSSTFHGRALTCTTVSSSRALLPTSRASTILFPLTRGSTRNLQLRTYSSQSTEEWAKTRNSIKQKLQNKSAPSTQGGEGQSVPTQKTSRPIPSWFIIFPFITLGLGTWQVSRRASKKTLLEKRDRRIVAEPIVLPLDLQEIKQNDFEFRRVVCDGEFIYEKEVLVGPRPFEGKTAYCVITPFRRAEDGTILLVNRGWIPADDSSHNTQPRGRTRIVAYIRNGETEKLFTPANEPAQNKWRWIDLQAISAAAGLKDRNPLFLEVAASEDPTNQAPTYPQPHNSFLQYWDHHLIYIFTWYTLTVCLLYIFNRSRARHGGIARALKQ